MALNANIPKDISLIGYDEMHMLTPFGYTISHSPSPSDMGALAVNMLLSRMEKTDSPLPIQRVLLPTNVKIETIDKKEMWHAVMLEPQARLTGLYLSNKNTA